MCIDANHPTLELQAIQNDLTRYYEDDLTSGVATDRPADNSLFTFLEMVELLKPMFKDNQMKTKVWNQKFKIHHDQRRMDTVLCVKSGLNATYISGGRFNVSGTHVKRTNTRQKLGELESQSVPVEITLEADDEASARTWVR